MKYARRTLMLGAGLVVLLMLVTVARARAVQDWYHSVTVQGRVTMWLLDDRAKVNGLLLDGGSQVRLSPRLAEAVVARAHTGDTVAVVGRGGSRSSFGQVVHPGTLTINGQTFTVFNEPHPGPRPDQQPGPRGPHGPGRGDAPPPHEAGRGQVPPPPPPADADASIAPPAPAEGRNAGPDPAAPPVSPDGARGPVAPDAPPPPPPPPPPAGANRVTVHGKVQTFLVGERGEVVGLALDSGEQVRVAPPVGEQLTGGSIGSHPDVVVEGDAVQGEQGTIIRATQVSIGTRTLIVQ